jgi:Arc/MetJ-type ribon-helix-helix transcriptional regulator
MHSMNQVLSSDTQRLIEERMRRGGYATPDAVVVAALASLEQQERFGDFEPGELGALLAEGEASGAFADGATALAARRRRREADGRSQPPAKSA